ncbi:hypothetical protein MMC12_001525 [Toensbergia leucococca]|nr:hypothetical protein [Toensbergia leucococca]
MTLPGYPESFGSSVNGYGSERGTRRRKFVGYLKAANELRQSYQQSYISRGQVDGEADEAEANIPGAFPDATIVQSGGEEMVLFPSYAKRHVKKKHQTREHEVPGSSQDLRSSAGTQNDAEYWEKEWKKYEDDTAIVDVDVRGWIYSPHKGPMTRKNKILLALARQMTGLPGPSGSKSNSRASSPRSLRDRRYEEEVVEKEVESITKKGEGEANIAWRGGYSEAPGRDLDDRSSMFSAKSESRSPSPEKYKDSRIRQHHRPWTDGQNDAPGPGLLEKRSSWNHPTDMTPAEVSAANAHLMARLTPFLTNPLASINLSIFFYNDKSSERRSVITDEASGHFTVRAALSFLPTHIRVIANEKLSIVEEVRITEPKGVSMISDIDDTIKHSGISSGAKEIFRNTFIRDLGDLTIDGVKEWYCKLSDMGVKLHYVSNSPWQLYPVLVSFFAAAGLPSGSFHLKRYTGMLQGIFEPVAERKKGTLERILSDFPERRFILVGDSGEADLELYTDIVIANPGRILGVFIRDVTTSPYHGFFDSNGTRNGERTSRSPLRGRGRNSGSVSPKKSGIKHERKPLLPTRQPTQTGPVMGTLIEFGDDPPKLHRSITESGMTEAERKASTQSTKSLPPRPLKPMALRSTSGEEDPRISESPSSLSPIRKGPTPPPKPRVLSNSLDSTHPAEPSPLSQTQNLSMSPPDARARSFDRQAYSSSVRDTAASVYNALPSPAYYLYGAQGYQSAETPNSSPSTPHTPSTDPSKRPPPPVPPRRTLTSYPVAAARYATNRISVSWNGNLADGFTDETMGNAPASSPVNKKEELWRRRWARARDIFGEKGVLLKSWRVGGDVMDEALRLVERANREDGGGRG